VLLVGKLTQLTAVRNFITGVDQGLSFGKELMKKESSACCTRPSGFLVWFAEDLKFKGQFDRNNS
jgi:hypothetical protein